MERSSNNPDEPTTVKQKPRKQPTECKICGASAIYSYYGAIVCGPCKVFFRRNAPTANQFKCRFDGHCEMNVNNRHVCLQCRLTKCFANGMQTELIRSPATAKTNSTTQNSNALVLRRQLGIVNILQLDRTILNVDQWNLLSNLTHCYDEHSGYSIAKDYLREQNQLPLKMRYKPATVRNFFTLITNGTQLLYEKNADFVSLCSHDRSILAKSTIKPIISISAAFILNCSQLFDNPDFSKSIAIVFGFDAYVTSCRLINFLDFDLTCMKLVLAILSFSTFDCVIYKNKPAENLLDVKSILSIQDKYAELTWRYLVYSFSYEQAVICFSNIVRLLLIVHAGIAETIESQNYTDMIDLILEQTERSLSLIE